jgi:hypothetical protein
MGYAELAAIQKREENRVRKDKKVIPATCYDVMHQDFEYKNMTVSP